MWQAEFVKSELQKHYPSLQVDFLAMSTRGDKILDSPLAKIGGKGLFVKELETALLSGEADIAVHSMKDVPMHFPEGLELGPICEREDPRDAFVSNHYATLDELPQGAIVGTSSLRRQCQIKQHRPDINIKSLRGNVNTRLSKLDAGEFDAIILAAAGLIRLELQARIASFIAPEVSLPACGQGAVGIELRNNDDETAAIIAKLHDVDTATCVMAERAMNTRLNGGCQVPIAGFAQLEGGNLSMRGLVGSEDGKTMLYSKATCSRDKAEQLGISIAEELLAQGAEAILSNINHSSTN